MKEDIADLVHQECNGTAYCRMVKQYYKDHGQTTPVQIDTVLVVYLITREKQAFDLLFCTHESLLNKIVIDTFNKYKSYLLDDDMNEMRSMIYEEFYRRVLFYRIPPDASFSGYVKFYLKKWLNVYTKIIVKKNQKTVLMGLNQYD